MAQFDWNLCIICQEARALRELKCPRNARGATPEGVKEIYSSFLAILSELRDVKVPLGDECKLESGVTAAALYDNYAKWHKNCKFKYLGGQVRKKIDDARKAAENTDDNGDDPDPARTRGRGEKFDKAKCVFCQQDSSDSLYNVTLVEFGQLLLEMARQLEDTVLLVRFGDRDLIAAEAKYHKPCLTKFYTRHRSHQRAQIVHSDVEQGITAERVILLILVI